MACEIHMLSVGAADAMIIKYMPHTGCEVVILIDAGHKADGPKIVNYIKENTRQQYIDLAICTHPDGDHIGGFFYIVNHVRIDEFWIHDPSKHRVKVQQLLESFQESKEIIKALKYVVESLDASDNLIQKIDRKGIMRTREPFAGLSYELAPLTVIGPTESYYELLLSRFRGVANWLEEEWQLRKSLEGGEILTEILEPKKILNRSNDKSKENNSSVIIFFTPEKGKFLFTSDAGPDALTKAAKDNDLSDLDWLDVPHHGSSYSLTSDLVDLFNPKIAYISCDGSTHYPNPAVVKYLKSKGTKVFCTYKGNHLVHSRGIDPKFGQIDAEHV